MEAKKLREQADELFGKRSTFMMLLQEIAENFYPERADFTLRRVLGTEFASNLMTSYPLMCRRDLGDQLGTMLRPTAKDWFHTIPSDTRLNDNESKRWLQWATGVQRRAMYDPDALFTRATKEGDHDFAAFGQCVLSIHLNRHREHLLYRCWHLRDVVWVENQDGKICFVARKWRPGARELTRLFPGKVHEKIVRTAEKKPFEEVEILHIVCEADMYDGNAGGKPRWSVFYDCQNDATIEATPVWGKIYVIPRWQTVSGSQYAYSPATIAALPDARLIQAMTYTLLEAGEKAVNPPVIATTNVIKSDIALYAGGQTWVDEEYDEKMGEALRPLTQDLRGMPLSLEMQQDTRGMLAQAFYLNKLRPFMPTSDPQMTAFQAGQIVADYIRNALPIFEPMEMDYNGGVCEETFDVLMRASAFGSPDEMPQALQGADIQFRFESPLHDAIEQQKGHKFLEMKGLIAAAVEMDQTSAALPDWKVALREALDGIGTPAKWVRSEVTVKQIEEQAKAAQAAQETLAAMEQSSVVAANLGAAQKDMAQAA